MTERNKSDYPALTIMAYADGKISRAEFIEAFTRCQKSNGINYDMTGKVDGGGMHVLYRGVDAEITGNGEIRFFAGSYIDPLTKRLRFYRQSARSFLEFRRRVDFAMNESRLRLRSVFEKWN